MPRRFMAGADAISTAEQTFADVKAQIEAERDLSKSFDGDRESSARATPWTRRMGAHGATSASSSVCESHAWYRSGDQPLSCTSMR